MTLPSHNPLERLVVGLQEFERKRNRHSQARDRAALRRTTRYPTLPMLVPEGERWSIPANRVGLGYEQLTVQGRVVIKQGGRLVVLSPYDSAAALPSWGSYRLRSSEGQLYTGNIAGPPDGWIAHDTAWQVNVSDGHWNIAAADFDTSWEYRRQLDFDYDAQPANTRLSWLFGGISWRGLDFTEAVTYEMALHADNVGLDTGHYLKVIIGYTPMNGWTVQGEWHLDTATLTSPAKVLGFPLPQPLWFTLEIDKEAAGGNARVLVSTTAAAASGRVLLDAPGITLGNFGQPWLALRQSRGAGLNDVLRIGVTDLWQEVM